MKIYHFNHPQQYYERVKNYLLQHEADHNLIWGTINNIIRYPQAFTEQPYLVVVDDPILAVAVRTPPRKLILSTAVNTEAIALIAQDIYSRSQSLPGVIAPANEAKIFAQMWQVLSGQSYKIGMQERIYQLETVQPIPKASGYLRRASNSDRELLISWCKAFTKEALCDM